MRVVNSPIERGSVVERCALYGEPWGRPLPQRYYSGCKETPMKTLSTLMMLVFAATAAANEDAVALTEQVRATEIAFAKTLADGDVKKFTRMIAPDVIWLADT